MATSSNPKTPDDENLTFGEDFLYERSYIHKKALSKELAKVHKELDLTHEEVLEAQEHFELFNTIDKKDFWSKTVALRSHLLAESAKMLLDEKSALFEEDLVSYCVEARFNKSAGSGTGLLADLDTPSEIANFCIKNVFSEVNKDKKLNQIGEWWQKELYQAAHRRSIPELPLPTTAESEAIILLHEVELLTEQPWLYTDRLLGAFERAHREIRNHARKHIETLKIYTRKLT